MIFHDFFRSQFRCLCHGNLMREPGRRHHTRPTVFLHTDRARNHISDAVDHADRESGSPIRGDLNCILRYKLRFSRHNCFTGPALGKLILSTFPLVNIFNMRNNQRFHHSLDECRFSSTYRTDDADIDIPTSPRGYFLINIRGRT